MAASVVTVSDFEYEWSHTFPTDPGWYFVGGVSGPGRGFIEMIRIHRRKDYGGNLYLAVEPELPSWAVVANTFGRGAVAYAKIPTPGVIAVETATP